MIFTDFATEASATDTDSVGWVLARKSNGEEDYAFEKRGLAKGVYEYLLNVWKTDEKDVASHGTNLSFAEVGKHFHAFPQEYRSHKTYRARKTEDHVFKGFGQVMPAIEGTALGATGNHYCGPHRQVCV